MAAALFRPLRNASGIGFMDKEFYSRTYLLGVSGLSSRNGQRRSGRGGPGSHQGTPCRGVRHKPPIVNAVRWVTLRLQVERLRPPLTCAPPLKRAGGIEAE
jgi:hypothetical protein